MSRHEIGIDLVDIDRIIGVLERFPNRFRERVLTEAEARYCGNKVDRIAGRWAAKEAICHLRDVEEMFIGRFGMILAMDNPKLAFDPTTPDRWAEERQYLRNDAALALAAFRARRDESLALLRTLTPEQWKRAGIHATRGAITINDFVTLMAWHDDNHLDQLKRALEGKA